MVGYKLFSLSFDKLIIRYYILMAVVIAAFFANVPLLALLALPIFLSSILGVQFILPKATTVVDETSDKTILIESLYKRVAS